MSKIESSTNRKFQSKTVKEVKKSKLAAADEEFDDIISTEETTNTEEKEVDDYINLDTDTFGKKKSKLQKKVAIKQALKNNLSNPLANENVESLESSMVVKSKKTKKNKSLNGKREATTNEEQYSSNWLNFLKKQKTEKDQATVKNASKKTSHNEILTPLRPIPNTHKGPTPLVALDCEMVLVQGNVQALARCSIVNYNGHCLFDKLIKPTQKVENYLPKITGLSYAKLKNAGTFEDYKDEIYNILKGKKIVGHTLKGDFEVLKINPEEKEVRDLSHYRPLREEGKLIGLKKMTEKHLKFRIQAAEHDSVEDARAAMALYRMFEKEWENELKEERLGKNQKPIVKKPKKKATEKKEQTGETEEKEEAGADDGIFTEKKGCDECM